MSSRFKSEVKIEEPYEFLADLKTVLEAEKQYASDDLPLYFLIDKTHTVGADYEPKNLVALVKNDDYVINKTTLSLRPDAAKALSVLGRAAQKDGVMLDVSSTYRSYEYQKNLFDYWVRVDGLEEAERESARPGTSQHQLGVAVDFGSIDDNYDKTPGGKWMYAHAAEYGWSLSFPKEYEDITGYRWECWHFRFIGVEACRFQKKWFNDVQQYMLEFIDEWKKS
ncbi:MAG: M15 family metallopeptidase [Treponema sp.]|nr:M15 family metallopeptidase [Treponema sp.]